MRLASLRRVALGMGLILATVHCSSDDDETPTEDAATDAHVSDAPSDSKADARDSSAGSAGSDGGDSSVTPDGSGGSAGEAAVDSGDSGSHPDVAVADADAAAPVDGGSDVHVDAPADAGDAHADAEASTPPVEASVDTGTPDVVVVDAPADVPVVPVDAGVDAVVDAAADVPVIPSDAGATFAQVKQIFVQHCATCHSSTTSDGGANGLIDLITPTGLYARLTGPLPNTQQGFCMVDGGADGGGAALHAIVPQDTTQSYLYLKVARGAPVTCGSRMPRVPNSATGSEACDAVDAGDDRCLSQADLDTIGTWIGADAPEN